MNISEDTRRVVDFLEDFSEGGLRKKDDLLILLQSASDSLDHKLMNNIIFTGKSIRNLYTKYKKTKDSNADILQRELARSADELKLMIDSLIPEDESIRHRFGNTYMNPTAGCLANLIDLAADLALLKDLQSRRSEFQSEE